MGKGNSPKLDETKELMILERSKLTVWSLFNSSLTTLVKKIHFFAQPRTARTSLSLLSDCQSHTMREGDARLILDTNQNSSGIC